MRAPSSVNAQRTSRRQLLSLRRTALLFAFLTVLLAVCTISVVGALVAEDRSLYSDLGVKRTATKTEIKQAFRRLTREHHPDTKDTFDEKEAAKVAMTRVLRAYGVLSDLQKRADYDATGHVPGEAIDPKEHSAEDIFNYYRQKAPIFSKTETLGSLTMLRRIKNFRGNRVTLIQVYDDECANCRTYAGAWETLFHSSLVTAGVVRMYRVDAKSAEGPALIRAMGTSYRGGSPTVIAFIDGERWSLFGIEDAVKRKQERVIFEQLLGFVMNFFYEAHVQSTSLQVRLIDDIISFLSAPRKRAGAARTPIRVLLPPLTAESVPLALYMRYAADAVVRVVPRPLLLEFVEQHCEQEVEVYDRRGEVVPVPEFVVVSAETLGGEKSAESEEHDEEEEPRRPAKGESRCNGIHIGASSALTYEKASEFVRSFLPPRHAGLPVAAAAKLTYLDASGFATACERSCLMWVRESCAVPTEALAQRELEATAVVLANNFLSFRPGYLCLDEQPEVAAYLRTVLPAGTGTHKSQRGPLLVALTGSDDATLYALTGLMDKAPLELSARDVDALLSHVLDAQQAQRPEYDGDVVEGDEAKPTVPSERVAVSFEGLTIVADGTPLSTLLPAAPFPLSTKQRYSLIFSTVINFVWPYLSNTAPFFMLWLVHTKILGRKNTDGEAPAGAAAGTTAGNANGTGATAPAQAPGKGLPKGFPTGKRQAKRPKSPEPPKPTNMVCDFTDADAEEARNGKGFLVLILDDREQSTTALKLPLIMSDNRFTVRTLSAANVAMKEWLRELRTQSGGGVGDTNTDASATREAEKGLVVFAVRKGRMQGALKPDAADMELFMRDLLDGTVRPQTEIPNAAWN